jgi:hypothetical protein
LNNTFNSGGSGETPEPTVKVWMGEGKQNGRVLSCHILPHLPGGVFIIGRLCEYETAVLAYLSPYASIKLKMTLLQKEATIITIINPNPLRPCLFAPLR